MIPDYRDLGLAGKFGIGIKRRKCVASDQDEVRIIISYQAGQGASRTSSVFLSGFQAVIAPSAEKRAL